MQVNRIVERYRSKKPGFVAVVLLLLFIFFVFGSSVQDSSAGPPSSSGGELGCEDCNVVLINLPGARPDHFSAYGYGKNTTPRIAELAEDGVLFTNAFAQASRTIAAGFSLLTSQYPYTNGVTNRALAIGSPSPETKTAAEIFAENGYATAAFADPLSQGGTASFGEYTRDFLTTGFALVNETGFTTPEVIDWLKENKDRKFFLFLQGLGTDGCSYATPPAPYDATFDPEYKNPNGIDYSVCYWSNVGTKPVDGGKLPLHEDVEALGIEAHLPPEDKKTVGSVLFDERDLEHLVALYDGNIAYRDSEIGKVVDALAQLGLDKNTIIVVTASEGELLGENGKFLKVAYIPGTFHDGVLSVPLVIKYPGAQEGRKVEGLVQSIDIVPTVLESVGIDNFPGFQGKSLSPLITKGEEINEYAYAGANFVYHQCSLHTFNGFHEISVVRNKEWKLTKETVENYDTGSTTDTYELYNIREDPRELNNVLETSYIKPEVSSLARDLRSKLSEWVSETKN